MGGRGERGCQCGEEGGGVGLTRRKRENSKNERGAEKKESKKGRGKLEVAEKGKGKRGRDRKRGLEG